ncbi:MAG: heparinase, partial [Armatimonadota bacterium]
MTGLTLALTLIALGLILFASQHPITDRGPATLRVDEIEQMLPEEPEGLGRPITDRQAWDALAGTDAYRRVVLQAEELRAKPLRKITDDVYLDFSRTGNRTRCQNAQNERMGRIAPLVLAECAECEGRFIAAVEELVAAICAERTWVRPAHDADLSTFRGKFIKIDLVSSALAWHLATANRVLGKRLRAETRDMIRDAVDRHVLEPWRAMLAGEREHQRWMYATSNWNAVCLAGVTGAGLAQVEDRRRRAESVAAAEHYSQNFLDGFPSDGYCSEGLGYWNYGFGNYIVLAETIYQATGGGVDLMA